MTNATTWHSQPAIIERNHLFHSKDFFDRRLLPKPEKRNINLYANLPSRRDKLCTALKVKARLFSILPGNFCNSSPPSWEKNPQRKPSPRMASFSLWKPRDSILVFLSYWWTFLWPCVEYTMHRFPTTSSLHKFKIGLLSHIQEDESSRSPHTRAYECRTVSKQQKSRKNNMMTL